MRGLAVALGFLLLAAPLGAREPLGVFGKWGAFRDDRPRHCFAIAEPEAGPGRGWKPFASVASWPEHRLYGQLHIRLRQPRKLGTPVILTIGEARFELVAGAADAWARDRRYDAAITREMRSAPWMRISARNRNGTLFSDIYALRGAATAMDAATVACTRRR